MAGRQDRLVECLVVVAYRLQLPSRRVADLTGALPPVQCGILGEVLGSAHLPTSVGPGLGPSGGSGLSPHGATAEPVVPERCHISLIPAG